MTKCYLKSLHGRDLSDSKKQGKLSPHFIGLFKVFQKIGKHDYKLELPPELEGIHNTFHVYYLRKCLGKEPDMIPFYELRIDEDNRLL